MGYRTSREAAMANRKVFMSPVLNHSILPDSPPPPSSRATRAAKALAHFRGVYRFRHKIDGCTLWYAMNERRQVIGVRLVRDGEDDAEAVVELAAMAYGGAICRPLLTLHRGASSASVSVLLRHAPRRLSVSPSESPASSAFDPF